MNAYERIKDAQRENEKFVLKIIRMRGDYPLYSPNIPIINAITRLVNAGKIRWHGRHRVYVRNK